MSDKILNPSELVSAIAAKTELKAADVDAVVKEMQKVIATQMKAGGEVRLPGFGTFKTSARAARTGRNPKTGEPMEIGARTVVSFSAGKRLKDSVN